MQSFNNNGFSRILDNKALKLQPTLQLLDITRVLKWVQANVNQQLWYADQYWFTVAMKDAP